MKADSHNTNFYKQYTVLKDGAFRSMKVHRSVSSQIKNYNESIEIKNKLKIEQKKKYFNELEYKVYEIKQRAEEIENQIEYVKKKAIKTEEIIKKIGIENDKLLEDRNYKMKELLSSKIKINSVYKSLKVKNVNDIIKKFNEESIKYENLYNMVYFPY